MSKLPISVFIIAQNEESQIAKAINSVINFAKEVIVIDSGSTDKTVEISKSLGAKVYFNQWPGFVQQKIFGESLCSFKWILNIDADEEVSDAFVSELSSILTNDNNTFMFFQCNVVMLHRFDHAPRFLAPNTKAIRFYHIDYAGFLFGDHTSNCHDSVVINPSYRRGEFFATIKNSIWHRSFRSIEQLLSKSNFYTSLQAEELYDKGRSVSFIRLIFEPFAVFFKFYFLKRYFVFGFNGFIDSVIYSHIKFIRLAKLYEKQLSSK